ncbi:hypothetical protein VTI74DRAFT_6107 [Chaetomium olivicolor]
MRLQKSPPAKGYDTLPSYDDAVRGQLILLGHEGKSEKAALEGQTSTGSEPPKTRRSGLLCKILGFFRNGSSKGPKPALAVVSQPRYNWRRPKLSSSLERGEITTARYFNYTVETFHCPLGHHSLNGARTAPWYAEFCLSLEDMESQLPGRFPWLENLHHCWEDKITVDQHPTRFDAQAYKRTISLAHDPSSEEPLPWQVSLTAWSQNAHLLASLTYSEMGGLVSRQTAVRIDARICYDKTRANPLEPLRVFYMEFPKPAVFQTCDNGAADELCSPETHVQVNEPELSQLVDKYAGELLPE